MTPLHTIRLGEPWQMEECGGLQRCSRRFGRPHDLPADERLHLVLVGFGPAPRVELNGHLLTLAPNTAGQLAADVTDLLAPRNELVVLVSPITPGGYALLHVVRAVP